MNRLKNKSFQLSVVATVVVGGFLILLNRTIPNHAGRPVSAWFQDLYSGVYGGTPKAEKFESAYTEFTRMETNVIPYLTKQLQYDRSGVRLEIVKILRRWSATKPFTANLTWPPEHRSYAAVALRQMGPRAEAAIPALLEAWANDAPEVKVNAVSALESILRGQNTDGASPAEWKKLESDVVTEAARRYPSVAEELGIGLERR